MNTTAILQTVAHRPWPLPARPWIMTQIWHELLFAHWPVAPEALRPLVPSALPLDTFADQAWVGVVPFRMSHVRPRWVPALPGLSQLVELNVRTYVSVNGKPGVYFFSLDASSRIAVAAARTVFHLPYFHAAMRSRRAGDTIHYRSHRTHRGASPAEYTATYRPIAPVAYAWPGMLAHWLTERYCLYTVNHGRVYRGEIHHLPWPLQAAELETACDTMAGAHGILLPDVPPLLHYAHRQEVRIWLPYRIGPANSCS
jgi:uncharacterized protein YqjF (DUF2071 family)